MPPRLGGEARERVPFDAPRRVALLDQLGPARRGLNCAAEAELQSAACIDGAALREQLNLRLPTHEPYVRTRSAKDF